MHAHRVYNLWRYISQLKHITRRSSRDLPVGRPLSLALCVKIIINMVDDKIYKRRFLISLAITIVSLFSWGIAINASAGGLHSSVAAIPFVIFLASFFSTVIFSIRPLLLIIKRMFNL